MNLRDLKYLDVLHDRSGFDDDATHTRQLYLGSATVGAAQAPDQLGGLSR